MYIKGKTVNCAARCHYSAPGNDVRVNLYIQDYGDILWPQIAFMQKEFFIF